jgi:hypothetical protein
MDIVKYSLLHLMGGDEAELFKSNRLHQMIELKDEDFVYSCQMTFGLEVTIKIQHCFSGIFNNSCNLRKDLSAVHINCIIQ